MESNNKVLALEAKVPERGSQRGILVIGILFFVFGFVTWLGSVLIPYLKIACQLSTFESYFVAFSFYISYACMALPASWVLKKTGSVNGMALGLGIMAAGAILFVPAAIWRWYPLFLLGLFLQGGGLTILQSASNPYVTFLGPRESAARRISIMGICNGVAGVMAPLILGSIILKDADQIAEKIKHISGAELDLALTELSRRVIYPYLAMFLSLLLLAALVYFSQLPDIDTDEEDEATSLANAKKTSIIQFPHLLLGVVTLFLYVGVEVVAVDTILGYAQSQGIPFIRAKFFASFTILNMLIGYVIGILAIPRWISQSQALRTSAIFGIGFAILVLVTHGIVSVVFVAMMGLANSLMWPSIWPLALRGLGRFTKAGSSLLIMAIGGGAIIPLLYGQIAQRVSPHMGYWVAFPIYLMILYYALLGHKKT